MTIVLIVLDPSNPQFETICVIDDEVELNQILREFLEEQSYRVFSFGSGTEFLAWEQQTQDTYDLVISDISMPGISGFALCKQLRARTNHQHRVPFILVTGGDYPDEKARGIEAGADDFIQKPYNYRELLAKVRSLLDIRAKDRETLGELVSARQRSEKLRKLTRFLPTKLGEILTSDAGQSVLKPHRGEVTVMFVDLRRFTAFSARAEPEEVLEVLGDYYTAVGSIIIKYGGTLGHLAGDGIMVFFNDPEPVHRHQEIAICAALEIRETLNRQRAEWSKREYDLDYGIGVAHGFATIGGIGFEQFWQYSVIGSVTNFAARLCQVADKGQILVSRRFLGRVGDDTCKVEVIADVKLKGISKPVLVHNVIEYVGDVLKLRLSG